VILDERVNFIFPIVGAIVLSLQRLLPLFQTIYQSFISITGSNSTIMDVLNLLDNNDIKIKSNHNINFNESIELVNVSYKYKTGDYILKNVNFKLLKGMKIGIIGKSGNGKSTLLNLIAGLIHPTEGYLKIDGVIINSDNVHGWYDQFSFVSQSIFFNDDTIKNNIILNNKNINIEEVVNVCKLVDIHNDIIKMPNQYQTIVGERGVRLSGGQIQRIYLARALLKNKQFIILDEATSSLDIFTEKLITDNIANYFNNKITLIMVAHRYSSLQLCDVIFKFENGNFSLTKI